MQIAKVQVQRWDILCGKRRPYDNYNIFSVVWPHSGFKIGNVYVFKSYLMLCHCENQGCWTDTFTWNPGDQYNLNSLSLLAPHGFVALLRPPNSNLDNLSPKQLCGPPVDLTCNCEHASKLPANIFFPSGNVPLSCCDPWKYKDITTTVWMFQWWLCDCKQSN